MAKLKSSVLSGLSGRLGDVVVYNRKGVGYARSLPRKNKNAPVSKMQQIQRAKFALAIGFASALTPLLYFSFSQRKGKTHATNEVMKRLLHHAIAGDYPDLCIDYSKVFIAYGSLMNIAGSVCESKDPETLTFSWIDNTGIGNAKADDRAILVAWHEESRKLFYRFYTTPRVAGIGDLAVPGMDGKKLHTWVSFVSDKGEVANSCYTGMVIMNG